jgi:uncharacterized DUF497 family protein
VGYEFEWDPAKAASNLKDHKVLFDEAATVFGDPLAILIADPRPFGRRGAVSIARHVFAGSTAGGKFC